MAAPHDDVARRGGLAAADLQLAGHRRAVLVQEVVRADPELAARDVDGLALAAPDHLAVQDHAGGIASGRRVAAFREGRHRVPVLVAARKLDRAAAVQHDRALAGLEERAVVGEGLVDIDFRILLGAHHKRLPGGDRRRQRGAEHAGLGEAERRRAERKRRVAEPRGRALDRAGAHRHLGRVDRSAQRHDSAAGGGGIDLDRLFGDDGGKRERTARHGPDLRIHVRAVVDRQRTARERDRRRGVGGEHAEGARAAHRDRRVRGERRGEHDLVGRHVQRQAGPVGRRAPGAAAVRLPGVDGGVGARDREAQLVGGRVQRDDLERGREERETRVHRVLRGVEAALRAAHQLVRADHGIEVRAALVGVELQRAVDRE